jgi:hypothetical protein
MGSVRLDMMAFAPFYDCLKDNCGIDHTGYQATQNDQQHEETEWPA